mmetsp:Transcript_48963/g.114576  ORF Transcript_48963/g.114576 Transcript_48963/m.114576 type:complete len:238 (-) Transcript_48963:3240-3953(-)
MHPLAQCSRSVRDIADELGCEVWILRVLLHLPQGGIGDIVLVEAFNPLQEVDIIQLCLGLRPRGGLIHDRHHSTHRLHHHVRWLRIGLYFGNGFLVQLLQRVQRCFQCGHCFCQVSSGIVGQGLGVLSLLGDSLGIGFNHVCLSISLASLLHNHLHQLLTFLLFLLADLLLLLEILTQICYLCTGIIQLLETIAELVSLASNLLLLLSQHCHVALHKLQVVCWGHIVDSPLLLEHAV